MIGSVFRGWMMCCDRVISLEDREWAILRASADNDRANVFGGSGFSCDASAMLSRAGEGSLLTSMCCSAS
jgi:hypothetical protein